MKSILPIPAAKQPLIWRQSISQSKFGKITWKNFFLYPLTKWTFSFKHHESALFDYVIMGGNPILTHLLVLQLYQLALQEDKKIKIGIYFTEDDFWSYHIFEQAETWNFLEKKFQTVIGQNVEQFYQQRQNIFQDKDKLDIVLIQNHNISISYYKKDELFNHGYIFHLHNKQVFQNDFEKAMPHVSTAENNIRLKYIKQYQSFLHTMGKQFNTVHTLSYSDNMQQNKDSTEKTHILLTQSVFLTSLPKWLNCTTQQKTTSNHEGELYTKTHFNHNLDQYAYGTAIHIANDFLSLEHQSLEDFVSLFKKIYD